MIKFVLNDKIVRTTNPSGSLLLDFIRVDQELKGTKIGCREGDCGACTVLVGQLEDGQLSYLQVTSCLTPIGNLQGKHVVTVEGLNMGDLSPIQEHMVDEGGTQCGFCTPGFIVTLTGYCLSHSKPFYEDAIAAIDGNICRCTGYKSIERATQKIVLDLSKIDKKNQIGWLVENAFIPSYFLKIPTLLSLIKSTPPPQVLDVLVGGGTDLYVQKPDELINRDLNFISNYPNLKFIKSDNGICYLGGGTTVKDMMASKLFQSLFPSLSKHFKLISSSPIRSISTIGGNLINASPIGDLTIFFLALNATITLTKKNQNRSIYLKDFFLGYKKLDRNKGEIVSSISFQMPSANMHFNFEKVSKRTHLDIASVNSASSFTVSNNIISQAHISAGGVGPTPKYLKETSDFLEGLSVTSKHVKEANKYMQSEISPISDVRGSESYKRILLRQLLYAHFIELFPDHISLKELV